MDVGDVWLCLATGAAVERGRGSEWSDAAAEALDGIADAVRQLVEDFGRHPSFELDATAIVDMAFDALRSVLERRFVGKDLGALQAFALIGPRDAAAAFGRLRAQFPTTRPGRPRAAWRADTIKLLRDMGVSRRDAEELADTAGLKGEARHQGQCGRAARQKQRARAQRRRNEKLPAK